MKGIALSQLELEARAMYIMNFNTNEYNLRFGSTSPGTWS